MSVDRFRNCLLACAELYGKEVSSPLADLWWSSLKGYDIAAVERAFQKHITNPDTGQFMPKPADIIRMVQGTTLDSAMIAWSKVEKAVRTIGPYSSVVFDDPVIHRVLQDMGGWISLHGKKDNEWPFVANEFRTRYKGTVTRDNLEYPRRMVGLTEAGNAHSNQKTSTGFVTYVGKLEECNRVEHGGVDQMVLIHRVQELGGGLLKLLPGGAKV